jgi:DNA polymerase bacteriophage-type
LTVLTDDGPLLVHNCVLGLGFGMGDRKLQASLKKPMGGVSVSLELDECSRLVNIYRAKNSKIKAGWGECKTAINAMYQGDEFTFGVGAKITTGDGTLLLPSGNTLRYPDLKREKGDKGIQHSYIDRENKKRKRLYGAKLTENVIQSMARDIIAWQAVQLKKLGWQTRGTVHDELLFVVPEDMSEKCCADVDRVMKSVPEWAAGCPISCEGAAAVRYGDT